MLDATMLGAHPHNLLVPLVYIKGLFYIVVSASLQFPSLLLVLTVYKLLSPLDICTYFSLTYLFNEYLL